MIPKIVFVYPIVIYVTFQNLATVGFEFTICFISKAHCPYNM